MQVHISMSLGKIDEKDSMRGVKLIASYCLKALVIP